MDCMSETWDPFTHLEYLKSNHQSHQQTTRYRNHYLCGHPIHPSVREKFPRSKCPPCNLVDFHNQFLGIGTADDASPNGNKPEIIQCRGGWRTARCNLSNSVERELEPMAEEARAYAMEIAAPSTLPIEQPRKQGAAKKPGGKVPRKKVHFNESAYMSRIHDVDEPKKFGGQRVRASQQGGYQTPRSAYDIGAVTYEEEQNRHYNWRKQYFRCSNTSHWPSPPGYEKVDTSWYHKSWEAKEMKTENRTHDRTSKKPWNYRGANPYI